MYVVEHWRPNPPENGTLGHHPSSCTLGFHAIRMLPSSFDCGQYSEVRLLSSSVHQALIPQNVHTLEIAVRVVRQHPRSFFTRAHLCAMAAIAHVLSLPIFHRESVRGASHIVDTKSEDWIWSVIMPLDRDGNPVEKGCYVPDPDRGPRKHAAGFMKELPDEIVQHNIWPRIVDGDNALENFQICSTIRGVCWAWLNHVEDQREWGVGILAWHRNRYPVAYPTDSSTDLDSEESETDSD